MLSLFVSRAKKEMSRTFELLTRRAPIVSATLLFSRRINDFVTCLCSCAHLDERGAVITQTFSLNALRHYSCSPFTYHLARPPRAQFRSFRRRALRAQFFSSLPGSILARCILNECLRRLVDMRIKRFSFLSARNVIFILESTRFRKADQFAEKAASPQRCRR